MYAEDTRAHTHTYIYMHTQACMYVYIYPHIYIGTHIYARAYMRVGVAGMAVFAVKPSNGF